MRYRFHRAAVSEHLDQVSFYESRLPGLGADYLAEFETVMARICVEPAFYPRVGTSDIRKAGLKRFPFHVIYQVAATQIVVLAIAHQRRRPTYWMGRIGK